MLIYFFIIMNTISEQFSQIFQKIYSLDFTPEISVAPKPDLGEYCINIFPLAKPLSLAPNTISETIATELNSGAYSDMFASASATGGYVNFFLTDNFWKNMFSKIQHTPIFSPKNETIVVDYIGMNVGKPPHI